MRIEKGTVGAVRARATVFIIVAGLTGLLAGSALAQEEVPTATPPVGAPQPGVEVPLRMTPQESQQRILRAGEAPAETSDADVVSTPSGVNPYQTVLEGYAPPEGAEGAEGEEGVRAAPDLDQMRRGTVQGGTTIRTGSEQELVPRYQGRVPGEVETPDHVRSAVERRASTRNQLTWIGFQPRESRARVFVETGRTPDYQVIRSADGMEVRIRLRGTENAISNHHRSIEAMYFGTAVQRVRAVRGPGDATDIVITLRQSVSPEVRVEGTTLFVDFGAVDGVRPGN